MAEALLTSRVDLSDYRSWLHEMPNGDAYVVDPISREPLDVTRPPDLFLQDERLRTGYEFLQRQGGSIDVTLLQSLHIEAKDLDTPTRPNFEQHVKRNDMLLVEGMGWNRPAFKKAIGAFRRGRPYDGNSFQGRWLNAAVQAQVLLTSDDVEDTRYAVDKSILNMWANYKHSYEQGEPYQQAFLVTQYLREWYMPGKLGHEIATTAFDGWFGGTNPSQQAIPQLNVLKIMGIGHLTVNSKFEACNVTTNVVHAKDVGDIPRLELRKEVGRALLTGFIPRSLAQASI